ncbi:MAG: SUMF1/EgtB/PvdO family nonheme iron enzyme [Crocinitomicaceae bacterium]|nr:SUMF1/EgtB/PvdO family nonheme iron enzyme [Crocinitomicaceae bacterium]
MKLISGLIAICIASMLYAQEPENVYPITKETREFNWYELQFGLWKKEIDANPKNANAWYNYYSAARAMRLISLPDSDIEKMYLRICDEIALEALKTIPETFEGNYIAYWNSPVIGADYTHVLKAHELDPTDSRAFDAVAIHYELKRDKSKFNEMCKKMFEANFLPYSLMNWGYNVLSELDDNAIVFTAGDNDTYALWLVQQVNGFRTDVTVLNTYLARIPEYRASVFKELNMSDYQLDDESDSFEGLYQHVFNNQQRIPTYVSTSAIHQFEKPELKENLYLTGLTYKYSKTNIDNISIIRRNYEKRYLMDYVKEKFAFHIGDEVTDRVNAMYLPSMIKLYKHYASSEEGEKMKELEQLIIVISEKSGQQSEIFELLGSEELEINYSGFSTALLDLKTIEKNMINLNGYVYMNAYETSNADYAKFLSNVLRSRKLELFTNVVYDSAQWVKKFPASSQEPMRNLYHWHPAYDEYPVVNVSHDAAKIYCNWLTQQYNLQRKRKYTKVEFRLPTEKEWTLAAQNGDLNSKTGLANDDPKNEKGCYLLNIKTGEGRYYDDGAFHTAKVSSYNPNKKGFYNLLGNVAEMVNRKDIAKGGCWYTTLEECYIPKKMEFKGPDPGIGFRIVMEVIEE